MKRHARSLQKKERSHDVLPTGSRGTWLVKSGSSDKEYRVFAIDPVGYRCTCEWAQWKDTIFHPCSHILKVENWVEESGNRRLSFWDTAESAARQRRPVRGVGHGLHATSRRLP